MIEIKHRWNADQTLYVAEGAADLGAAVKQAVACGTDLRNANLRDADLRNADLRNANLRGVYLRGADLRHANLTGADLRGASLADADLTDAELRGADLRDGDLSAADLPGANLREARLAKTHLAGADLTGAALHDADFTGSGAGVDLTGVILTSEQLAQLGLKIPRVEHLDTKVLTAVTAEGGRLQMSCWHEDETWYEAETTALTCGSAHCRAGWAIHLAGKAGYALENQVGSNVAGALIYLISTGRPVPCFYTNNAEALNDIRRCAAEEAVK